MDLTLYGICFKMRGSMDLLDYIQSNTPVPIEIMQQVMDQMDSVTGEEMDFARKLKDNWKKAFNEKAPLTMDIAEDGGYEIICSVPDELLDTVHVLTGLEGSKIVEEYTAEYLKAVCGIDANIISVDMEGHEKTAAMLEPAQGFDINDLGEKPDEPAFEDVGAFNGIETQIAEEIQEADESEAASAQGYVQEDAAFSEDEGIPIEDGYPDGSYEEDQEEAYQEEDQGESYQEETYQEDTASAADASQDEDGYLGDFYQDGDDGPEYEDEDGGYAEDEPAYEEHEQKPDPEKAMQEAIAEIYKDFIGNIRDRELDRRLNLKIGQQ